MSSNLDIYNIVRTVPENAQKKISGGRLSGKTDINPMWRLKVLTETFGVCGIGWRYDITKQWTEEGANGEMAAFVNIDMRIKVDGAWSEAIPGTGGSVFIAKEKSGLYTSDECYKMALTDAISVACKALGVGADIYWGADSTKYDKPDTKPDKPQEISTECKKCGKEIKGGKKGDLIVTAQQISQSTGGYCIGCAKHNTNG